LDRKPEANVAADGRSVTDRHQIGDVHVIADGNAVAERDPVANADPVADSDALTRPNAVTALRIHIPVTCTRPASNVPIRETHVDLLGRDTLRAHTLLLEPRFLRP